MTCGAKSLNTFAFKTCHAENYDYLNLVNLSNLVKPSTTENYKERTKLNIAVLNNQTCGEQIKWKFMNSFLNYIEYESLKEAAKRGPFSLIDLSTQNRIIEASNQSNQQETSNIVFRYETYVNRENVQINFFNAPTIGKIF